MQPSVICENSACRFLVSLREGNRVLRLSELIMSECPECGHRLSACCPFCQQILEVIWQGKVPRCSVCSRSLQKSAE